MDVMESCDELLKTKSAIHLHTIEMMVRESYYQWVGDFSYSPLLFYLCIEISDFTWHSSSFFQKELKKQGVYVCIKSANDFLYKMKNCSESET